MKTNYAYWHRSAATVIALALIMGGAGCASSRPTRSGYLSDYTALQPVQGRRNFLATPLSGDLARRPITVVPLTWNATADLANPLTPAQRAEFLRVAQAEWARAFSVGGNREAASQSPWELRATVSALNLSNPSVNVVSTLAFLLPFDNGGVGVEWQLVDPATGRVWARGAAAHAGRPWHVTANFRETGHALQGVKNIATQVAAYLGRPVHS